MSALDGKVAVITGAAGGIGAPIARMFAAGGAHLALIDANTTALHSLAATLRDQGAVVHVAVADLSTQAGVRDGIGAALAPYDHRVDILIANVGKLINGWFHTLAAAQWEEAFAINFYSHVWAIEAVVPLMLAQASRGAIVCVGSDQGLQPDAGLAPYAVCKAALHSLVKVLARELGPQGIWVNAIAPGMTRTPLVERLMEMRMEEWKVDRQEAEDRELAMRGVPLARLGEPEEIARVVMTLATEPFSNGAIWDFSGGNVRSVAS